MAPEEKLSAKVTTAASDIGAFIRSQRETAQVSVRQLAERAGGGGSVCERRGDAITLKTANVATP